MIAFFCVPLLFIFSSLSSLHLYYAFRLKLPSIYLFSLIIILVLPVSAVILEAIGKRNTYCNKKKRVLMHQ